MDTEMQVVIYRLTERKVKRFTKAQKAQVEEALATARVKRDDVVDFFVDGAMDALPVLPDEFHNAPRLRALKGTAQQYGWIVPASNLGRATTVTQSTVNSLRLWVKQNLGVDGSTVMIVAEPIG